ncbi:hypothetical protein M2454_000794 [Aequitasia blattaphilus]|uniref:Uncharacterized protein n=1 Tax=Aequitasia blattaphilus TaxID=2949332 RepID=A0ABT1E849_9FIRM|nr:hypothetical protein [Aequitasia blattaphilus]MCP1101999.1 hypothetical protein [Aequitasia blattaphilus]MCR8614639.1 hypothetical protein [Aequitasia blattaphilus]
MENDREMQNIMMNMRGAGAAMRGMFLFNNAAAVGTVMLLNTFIRRMVSKKLLKPGEAKDLESFIAKTGGAYQIYNIPAIDQEKLKEELTASGLQFSILPDLNKNDGIIQVAIDTKDKDRFMPWFERHVLSNLKGGEKKRYDLENLTNGNVSIISIPFEDQVTLVQDDFSNLGINYTILPDLNVGDGEIQIMVANADVSKAQHWYKVYSENLIKSDPEAQIGDMKVIGQEQYLDTARTDERAYIENAATKYQEANKEFERPPGELEMATARMAATQSKTRTTADIEYENLKNNINYVEISINHKTLVEESSFGGFKETQAGSLFASRIPGTWGDSEQTLVVDADNVFLADDGITYVTFLERDKAPIVLDQDGKPIASKLRESGQSIFNNHYDIVNRKFKDKSKVLDKTIKPVKMPTPPKLTK